MKNQKPLHENRTNGIPLTMVYLDAFLPWDRDMAKRARLSGTGFIRRRIMGNRPLEWTVSEEDIQFRFHMLPEGWMKKTEKLCGRLQEAVAEAAGGNQIWIAPGLRNILGKSEAGAAFRSRPVPEPALMRLLWKQQEFCPYMTVIMPDFGKEDFYEEIEAEADVLREFLEDDYNGLNGLLLVSRALEGGSLRISLEEEVPYYSHIYQDTGLPVICAGSPAGAHSRGSICIDMRPGYRIAFRRLPENAIYLDMTSEAEKERLLCAKRKDISYVSALNILDTYVRKRYNTNRYRESGDSQPYRQERFYR